MSESADETKPQYAFPFRSFLLIRHRLTRRKNMIIDVPQRSRTRESDSYIESCARIAFHYSRRVGHATRDVSNCLFTAPCAREHFALLSAITARVSLPWAKLRRIHDLLGYPCRLLTNLRHEQPLREALNCEANSSGRNCEKTRPGRRPARKLSPRCDSFQHNFFLTCHTRRRRVTSEHGRL